MLVSSDPPVPTDPLERGELRDLLVLMANRVNKEEWDPQDVRALQDHVAAQDPLELKVSRAKLDPKDRQATEARQANKVIVDPLVQREKRAM